MMLTFTFVELYEVQLVRMKAPIALDLSIALMTERKSTFSKY